MTSIPIGTMQSDSPDNVYGFNPDPYFAYSAETEELNRLYNDWEIELMKLDEDVIKDKEGNISRQTRDVVF